MPSTMVTTSSAQRRSDQFEEDPTIGCWDIQLLIFWGHLLLEVVYISSIFDMVWSPELKFQIWGRSDQWLLRYSTFNILRSSSIGGHLCCKHIWFWFGPLSLSLKFEKDLISFCWDIQFLISRLSSIGVRLYFIHFGFWFGPLSFSFEEDPTSGC